MKRTLALISIGLLNLLSGSARQTTDSPSFLYASHDNLSVVYVDHQEDATVLAMHYQGSPYGSFNIRSSMRLVDEQGRAVPITSIDEFPLNSIVALPENGQMDFILRFPSLARGTRIFDLIEGQPLLSTKIR